MHVAGKLSAAIALSVLCVPVSEAVPVLVTSRAALSGTDHFDWGSLGPSFTVVSDPFVLLSVGGTTTATVLNPLGGVQRLDQGNGWNGNFAPGDELIWTQNLGYLSITFDTPVSGFGAQFQRNLYEPFNVQVDIYNSTGTLIGQVFSSGNSTALGDNSAIFVGARDSTASIGRIDYSILGAPALDFAINQLDIVPGDVEPVPEPGTLALVSAGLLALRARRRRQE